MEIKIGIPHITRELSAEVDASAEEIAQQFNQALRDGELFQLKDTKGRLLVVPSRNVAYLDFGVADARPVGFGTI